MGICVYGACGVEERQSTSSKITGILFTCTNIYVCVSVGVCECVSVCTYPSKPPTIFAIGSQACRTWESPVSRKARQAAVSTGTQQDEAGLPRQVTPALIVRGEVSRQALDGYHVPAEGSNKLATQRDSFSHELVKR